MQMAEVEAASGPIGINREDVQRRIVVSFNVHGADLTGVVNEARAAVAAQVQLPPGYYVEYGGQFEAQQAGTLTLWLLFPAVLLGVFLLLCKAVESWRAALQILVNIPLAFFGAIVAILITSPPAWEQLQQSPWYAWPAVWIGASTLSLAHWVGFITLTGIVARNGIMMISHYLHLMRYEGEQFDERMIVRGTLERLTPVLMTAATSIIGLTPLLLGAGETGKEILYPLAIVVVGGMISSTLLDQLVTPALFFKFGRKVYQPASLRCDSAAVRRTLAFPG
jgi:Cu/Ag efflux pump CusA